MLMILGRKRPPGKKGLRGFTLLELMIVVAVVAILAAIAYPSYMDSVRKSNRSDAKAALSEAAQRLQRCYTANYSYQNCAVRELSSEGFYGISIDATENTFDLTAQAVAGTVQAGDHEDCRTFTLDHRGERGPERAIAANCW